MHESSTDNLPALVTELYPINGGHIRVHAGTECAGQRCAIHNPTDHHMRDWPRSIRADRHYLIERICKHGCGHPDPDSLYYIKEKFGDDGRHGCCGCCSTDSVDEDVESPSES